MNDHVVDLLTHDQGTKLQLESQEAESLLLFVLVLSAVVLSALVAGHKFLFPLAAKMMLLPSISPTSRKRNTRFDDKLHCIAIKRAPPHHAVGQGKEMAVTSNTRRQKSSASCCQAVRSDKVHGSGRASFRLISSAEAR
jgi:hypothetical protein